MTQLKSQSEPIAIIGIGCMFPKADSLEAYWANIREGVDAITPIPDTHWRVADYFDGDPKSPDMTYAKRGGFIEPYPFDPLAFGISPNNLEATDTTQLLGMVAARQAMIDAGYGPAPGSKTYDRNRVSVILGVTGTLELVIPLGARLGHPIWRKALKEAGVDGATADDVVQRIADGYVPWQENSFPGLLGNVAAGRIANRLDLGGTNCVVDAACASSLSAMHLACMELQTGKADMVLTGGLDTFNDIFMYMCFSKTPALSPTGDAKPFDAKADGTILGEGLGVVLAKRLSDAERDGDRIYAVIRSIGSSSDGKGNAIYAPSAEGQVKALNNAYREAGVTPNQIELIEAHGTGTKVGDATEITALSRVYGEAGAKPASVAIGSVKSQIGHTKAAAGAAGVIKAVMALHHKTLPPTIKVNSPNEAVDPDGPIYVNAQKRPWLTRQEKRLAAVSAFGFGGSNFHCVLEEYDPAKTTIDWDGRVQVVALSGDSAQQIASKLTDLSWPTLRDEAHLSRRSFDAAKPARLLLVIDRDRTDLNKLVDGARKMLASSQATWSTPDGAYFGSGNPGGKIGVLFPGQGSQYVGMLRDLACAFPQMFNVLGNADRDVLERVYPVPAYSDEQRAAQDEALRNTAVAQPALGAVSLGAWRVLEHFGIRGDAFAGHSFGELTALCAAGRYDEATLHKLSALRGRLMAAGEGDRGAMLAVSMDRPALEKFIAEAKLDLVIANHNAPQQAVLSGATQAVERAAALLKDRGVRCKRLSVSAAFHSRFVADSAAAFGKGLDAVAFGPAGAPVYADATAEPYAGDVKTLLAKQLASPVRFVDLVGNMHAAGVRTFIEAGPGATLTGLVKSILGDRPHVAIALDASVGKRSNIADLAALLAQLASLGVAVDLSRWDGGHQPAAPKKPGMTIPICGANYVQPRPQRPASPPRAVPAPASTLEPVRSSPVNAPSNDPVLRVTQDGLLALQKLQEQTAKLHQQFLEGQQAAQRNIAHLIEQQQRMIAGAPLASAMPALSPPPAPQAVAAEVRVPAAQSAAPVEVRPAIAEPVPARQESKTPAPAPVRAADSRFEKALLETVAEKTGYPAEMLNLDMQLEADLGIDSIKRVEILSAMQEKLPDAPAVKPEDLGSLHTLRQIVDFMNGAPGSAPAPAPAITGAGASAPSSISDSRFEKALLETVAEKTGYPAEMLNLDMQLEADLGIDSIKRVEILSAMQEKLPDAPAVKPEDLGSLHTLRQIVDFMNGGSDAAPSPAAPAAPQPTRTIEPEPTPVPAPRQPALVPAIERSVLGVESIPDARPTIKLPTDQPLWIVDDGSPLTTTLARRLKELGLSPRRVGLNDKETPKTLAGLVIIAPVGDVADSFLFDVFSMVQRCAKALQQTPGSLFATVSRLDGAFGFDKTADPVAGGLSGISKTAGHEWSTVHCRAIDLADDFDSTAHVAHALADELLRDGPVEVGVSRSRRVTPKLTVKAIQGGTATPVNEGDVVVITGGARGVTAEVAVAIAKACRPTVVLLGRSEVPAAEPDWLAALHDEAQIKAAILHRAEKPLTPKQVEAQCRAHLSNREILANLARMEQAGAKVIYKSVDVRDAMAVKAALAGLGAIRGVVHGAGVLADRLIVDKTAEQFEQVYSTKVDGLRAVLAAAGDDLKFMALFSSSTGRFGRKGQIDYAAANEVLNKFAQREAKNRPGCRVVSMNWGPWDGGMVNASLRKVFENEGVDVIPLDLGAEALVREISLPAGAGSPVEVVILGARKAADEAPMHPAVEIELDVERFPFLRSHVLDGKAVVPVAMIVEWLAHGAMHDNPGYAFVGFDDLRVLKGVVLPGEKATRLRVLAGAAVKTDDVYRVPVELRGEHLHVRAAILLGDAQPRGEASLKLSSGGWPKDDSIYGVGRLFHGPVLQGITAVTGCGETGVSVAYRSARAPGEWIRQPMRGSWITDPLAIDSAFQALILWTFQQRNLGSLPTQVGRYRQFRRAFPKDGGRIVAVVKHVAEHEARADIEFVDNAGQLVARIEDYACVIDRSLNDAFERNTLEPQLVS